MNNKEDIDQLLARYFAGEPLSLVQQKELTHGLRLIDRSLNRCTS